MKTIFFFKGAFLCVACIVIFAGTSSFTFKETNAASAQKRCSVSCTWTATTAAMTGVSISSCSATSPAAPGGTAPIGGSFSTSVAFATCAQVFITTSLATGHPAGTISIYKNVVLVLSHTVPAHSRLDYDDQLDAACGDVFVVTF